MSGLTPVLRYLKSWGQHDAYDRVLAARDHIDFQAEVIDSQGRRIEALEAERDEARADAERLTAEVARLREAAR